MCNETLIGGRTKKQWEQDNRSAYGYSPSRGCLIDAAFAPKAPKAPAQCSFREMLNEIEYELQMKNDVFERQGMTQHKQKRIRVTEHIRDVLKQLAASEPEPPKQEELDL